jgi:glycosyltransferase involved in cell wall biosynthesis
VISEPRAVSPRFSVVVPALNESAYIAECLRSLAAQDFTGPVEVIVVDNDSTDDTGDIARAMGATVVTETEAGVCCARQRGTEAARGEIVVSTDADTTFDHTWLSRIDRVLTQNPGAVAVAGPCRFADGPLWASVYPRLLFGLVHVLYLATGRVCYITATNTAFRKSAWSGYDTRLTQGGDELDLLRRLRARGRVVFDTRNATLTSARRLNRGLFYNITVTLFFYYLFGYGLNRLSHRRLVGTAPVFRGTAGSSPPRRWLGHLVAACMLVMMTLFMGGIALELVALV